MNAVPQNVVEQPSMSQLLSTVAVTVELTSSSLGLKRKDKNASIQTAKDHFAKEDSADVMVSRLSGAEDQVKAINKVVAEASKVVKRYTSTWGKRDLMPNVNIEPFLTDFGGLKQEHTRLVDRLVQNAPNIIAAARQNKGTFNVEPPTEDEIRDAFALDFQFEPIAPASNFQTSNLSTEMEAALRRQFEANAAAAYAEAQADAIRRLAKPLSNYVDRMEAYNDREDRKDQAKTMGTKIDRTGYFRDSIMGNINDVMSVFRSFNLTADPALNHIADQVEACFNGVDVESLKESRNLRDGTAAKAKAILNQLEGWL